VIPELRMPTYSTLISEHVERTTCNEWLRDARSNGIAGSFSPHQNRARGLGHYFVGCFITQFVSHRFENELPFLLKTLLVLVKVDAADQVVAKPPRSLLKRSVIVSNRRGDAALCRSDQVELPHK